MGDSPNRPAAWTRLTVQALRKAVKLNHLSCGAAADSQEVPAGIAVRNRSTMGSGMWHCNVNFIAMHKNDIIVHQEPDALGGIPAA